MQLVVVNVVIDVVVAARDGGCCCVAAAAAGGRGLQSLIKVTCTFVGNWRSIFCGCLCSLPSSTSVMFISLNLTHQISFSFTFYL